MQQERLVKLAQRLQILRQKQANPGQKTWLDSLAEATLKPVPTAEQFLANNTPSAGSILGSLWAGPAFLARTVTSPVRWGLNSIGVGVDPAKVVQQNALNQRKETLQAIAGVGALGLAGGLGLRGLQGVGDSLKEKPNYDIGVPTATIPLPVKAKGKEKRASPWTDPLFLGGAAVAGTGGAYAGYAGLDAILSARRQAARKRELERAKQEFESALLSSYPQAKTAEQGSEQKSTAEYLDEAFALFKKTAAAKEADAADWVGGAANLYGLYAAGTGLLAGATAFDYARRKNKEKIFRKAIQERARQNVEFHPLDLTIEPRVVGAA